MNPRLFELAEELKIAIAVEGFNIFSCVKGNTLEAFYQLAHQDGQRAMRERAAAICFDDPWQVIRVAEAIRLLEIE